jgi:hypothetical protein
MSSKIKTCNSNRSPVIPGLFVSAVSLILRNNNQRLFEGWFWGTNGNTFMQTFFNFDCDPTQTNPQILPNG